jgi:hypothetical protein
MDRIKFIPVASQNSRVNTWAETAKALAAASESWDDWDVTASDGLSELESQVRRQVC